VILTKVGIGDLKIKPRICKRCEIANSYCSASLLHIALSSLAHSTVSSVAENVTSGIIFSMYKESTFVQLDMLCIGNRDA